MLIIQILFMRSTDIITPRERQILWHLANDFTTRELAQYLHISAETVKSHRSSLIRKLGAKTTGGLIRKGFELGILTISRSS